MAAQRIAFALLFAMFLNIQNNEININQITQQNINITREIKDYLFANKRVLRVKIDSIIMSKLNKPLPAISHFATLYLLGSAGKAELFN